MKRKRRRKKKKRKKEVDTLLSTPNKGIYSMITMLSIASDDDVPIGLISSLSKLLEKSKKVRNIEKTLEKVLEKL